MTPGQSSPCVSRWYVAQTQPLGENKAVFNLNLQGFRIFCPRVLKTVRHARKTHQVHAPLFPGYVFVSMNVGKTQWRSINGTIGVSHLLMVGDRPQAVPGGVVETLLSRIDKNGVVDWTCDFYEGQTVRITDGAFEGFIGTLQHLDAHGRVQVLLELMGRGVNASLRVSALAPDHRVSG